MTRINNLISLKSKRKGLRSNLTPAEARLWKYINGNQLGKKFRRQHSIGYYIVDFYCPQSKLVIELDGSPHDTEQGYEKDKERSNYLEGAGAKVIRFQNQEVIKNLEGVLEEIKKYLV